MKCEIYKLYRLQNSKVNIYFVHPYLTIQNTKIYITQFFFKLNNFEYNIKSVLQILQSKI